MTLFVIPTWWLTVAAVKKSYPNSHLTIQVCQEHTAQTAANTQLNNTKTFSK